MNRKREFGAITQILAVVEGYKAFPVQVADTGVTAGTDGRKIIPAGTPVGGATSYKDDPATKLTVVSDDTVQGVLLHDTDVTDGAGNGTLLVDGYVNTNRLGKVTISDDVKTALAGKVDFVNR
jgi:hypothetical protein